jgi:hypothetical protein
MTTDNQNIIAACLEKIPARDRAAMLAAAQLGYGEARNIDAILKMADQHGARRRVVAAFFGFLRDGYWPEQYADAFHPQTTMPHCDSPTLDNASDPEVTAAFALSRAIWPWPLPSQFAHDILT